MITAEQQPLPEGKAKELREWLERPGFDILIRVLEAQQKHNEAQVIPAALLSLDHPAKIDTANAHLLAAHRYAVTIATLREIVKLPKFHDVKLT